MKLSDGAIIDPRGYRSSKFGNDPMTEYIYGISLDQSCGESDGEAEAPTGWFARIGRQMIGENGQSFVARERFATVELAQARFAEMADDYSAWLGDDDE